MRKEEQRGKFNFLYRNVTLKTLLQRVKEESSLIEAEDCVRLIYAISKLNLKEQELMKQLIKRVAKKQSVISNEAIGSVYSSLARLKFDDLTHFRYIHEEFARRLHRKDEKFNQYFTADKLAQYFWSYGRLKMLSFREQNVLKQLGQLLIRDSESLSPKEIAIIMQSLVALKYKQKDLWTALKNAAMRHQRLTAMEGSIISKSVIKNGAKAHDIPLILKSTQAIVIAHKFRKDQKLLDPRFYVHALSNLVKLEAFDFKLISQLHRRIFQVKDQLSKSEIITATVAYCRIKKRYRGPEKDLQFFNISNAIRTLAKVVVKNMKKFDRRSRVMLRSSFESAKFHDSGLTKSFKFYRVY